MNTRKLRDLDVSAIGLGCMGMSQSYLPIPDRKEMIALARTAVERGSRSSTPHRSTGRSRTKSSSEKRSSPSANGS